MSLRLLDPVADLDLYRESFSWRPSPKKHVGTNRMSFEKFADPQNIVVGLFIPEFVAVYVFHELEPGTFQCHFTAKPKVPREILLEGAKEVVSIFLQNGAGCLVAYILPRNIPIRRFVEAVGFECVGLESFPCNETQNCNTIQSDTRQFSKYVLQGVSPSG